MNFNQIKQNEIFMLDKEQKGESLMFTSLAEMDEFDDAIRKILKAQQDKLNLTDEAVGKIAFSFMDGRLICFWPLSYPQAQLSFSIHGLKRPFFSGWLFLFSNLFFVQYARPQFTTVSRAFHLKFFPYGRSYVSFSFNKKTAPPRAQAQKCLQPQLS